MKICENEMKVLVWKALRFSGRNGRGGKGKIIIRKKKEKNELVHSPINKMTKGENRNWKKGKILAKNLYIFALLKDII